MILPNSSRLSIIFIQSSLIIPLVNLLINYLDPLITFTITMDRQHDLASMQSQNQDTTFDYIIVGAGSAGSILASRLTENPSIRVLLLEAGGTPNPIVELPTMAFLISNKKSHDWQYRTVPQRNASLSLNDRTVFWPAGKSLGGSSAINGLIYIRGNIQGYNLIAERTGDPIWNSRNILNFYKKVEKYEGRFLKEDHGENGDLTIEAPAIVPVTKRFLEAGREMGYPTRDPNAHEILEEGFAPIESYMNNGARADAYHATLKKVLTRNNLVLRKYSYVTRLLFRPGLDNEVIGLEYERHDKIYQAFATKETILSAGALSSPKILMLSGIGPRQHLAEMDIPLRVDLPVGQRLQDKYGALIGPFIVPKGYSFNQERDINMESIWDWFANGKGQLASGRTEATFAVLSEHAKRTGDTYAPDIHSYILSQTPVNVDKLFGRCFNFKQEVLDYMTKSTQYGDGFFQLVTTSRPIGFGTVRLKDTNPHSLLEIDPKYLENQHDLKILLEGIRFAVNLIEKTKSMQGIGAQLFRLPFPGCQHLPFKSEPYFECLARHATITAYKYCGTAPIGTRHDPDAVVDSRFRVFGTKRLRIIDGSLLRINEVNTNDVTMRMIGELGAHVLKETWS